MNQKTRFPMGTQPKDQPIADHPFYLWLMENENTLDTRSASILSQYLDHLGFVVTRHTLDPDVITELRMVHDFYSSMWMPTRTIYRLDELFIPTEGGYWLRDGSRTELGSSKVSMTHQLRALIEEVSPIYELGPDNYYFEVIKGVLFLKYQHIIGSRRLCPIYPEDLNHG